MGEMGIMGSLRLMGNASLDGVDGGSSLYNSLAAVDDGLSREINLLSEGCRVLHSAKCHRWVVLSAHPIGGIFC